MRTSLTHLRLYCCCFNGSCYYFFFLLYNPPSDSESGGIGSLFCLFICTKVSSNGICILEFLFIILLHGQRSVLKVMSHSLALVAATSVAVRAAVAVPTWVITSNHIFEWGFWCLPWLLDVFLELVMLLSLPLLPPYYRCCLCSHSCCRCYLCRYFILIFLYWCLMYLFTAASRLRPVDASRLWSYALLYPLRLVGNLL